MKFLLVAALCVATSASANGIPCSQAKNNYADANREFGDVFLQKNKGDLKALGAKVAEAAFWSRRCQPDPVVVSGNDAAKSPH